MAELGPDRNKTSNPLAIASKGTSLQVLAIVVGALILAAAILFPVFRKSRMSAYDSVCLANMKRSAAGMLMYAEENNGALPGAAAWMDRVEKYVPQGDGDTGSRMRCPATGRDEYGFSMVDGLGFANLSGLNEINKKVLIFESSDLSRNAHANEVKLPDPPRHSRSTIAYADGRASVVFGGQKL